MHATLAAETSRPIGVIVKRRAEQQRTGQLEADQDVRELVLDRLEAADRLAELGALPGVAGRGRAAPARHRAAAPQWRARRGRTPSTASTGADRSSALRRRPAGGPDRPSRARRSTVAVHNSSPSRRRRRRRPPRRRARTGRAAAPRRLSIASPGSSRRPSERGQHGDRLDERAGHRGPAQLLEREHEIDRRRARVAACGEQSARPSSASRAHSLRPGARRRPPTRGRRPGRPPQSAGRPRRREVALFGRRCESHRGSPSSRSATTLRWISLVPA